MKKLYHYLGRDILIYATDFLTWLVMIDDGPLYSAESDERKTFTDESDAKRAAFKFVLALSEDEV